MKCDLCQDREAQIFLKQSINGKEEAINLCHVCAEQVKRGDYVAKNAYEQQVLEKAERMLGSMGSVQMGMDFTDPTEEFLEPFRDLIQRFNRPVTRRTMPAGFDMGFFPFASMRPMWPSEPIAIPDPESRAMENRASRLVFNDDGSVSLAGEGDEGKTTEHKPESVKPKVKDPDHVKDAELKTMDFEELMHFTDDFDLEGRKKLLKRRQGLAVQQEDYELAAEIRDALKDL